MKASTVDGRDLNGMKQIPGWATYLRVSDDDKQTPERSFAMQRQRISEKLLVPSSLSFSKEYRDILTGKVSQRVEYQQMLADADAGRYSHLGLYRADRFGRDAVEGLQAATKLIGLGVKLRVASMPSLMPETPDGFFMFLIQMGLAQREVDVLALRTRDGMEAKLRAGGWPNKAPEGYVNKERLIKSGKYERWVEPDPILTKGLKKAWELLLTGRYTLVQICEELTKQGYSRSSNRPWSWTNSKSGERQQARNRLSEIFHNPFYAGWVFSKRFGIASGEIRGRWDPVVTPAEFDKGLKILRANDRYKARASRHFYLLKNLLWAEVNGNRYKMYCSKPSGRSRSYPYYITHAKPQGKAIHIPCSAVDEQIQDWLRSISVDPTVFPEIQKVYREQIDQVTQEDRQRKKTELKGRITQLRQEEAKLARLFMIDDITDETYKNLREEWLEKLHHAEMNLVELEKDVSTSLSDLDKALLVMSKMHSLYERLKSDGKTVLLSILTDRIIVDPKGKIITQELHSPFAYLRKIANDFNMGENGNLSIPWASANSRTNKVKDPVEHYLSGLRFEGRKKLGELSL